MAKQMSINYNPRHAWMRAAVYFVACFAIAHFSGAFGLVLGVPLALAEDLQDICWILFTLLCIAVEIWAYVYLWPRGTLTHGRPLYWSVVLTFGVLWGLSEGLLFLSVFVLASQFIISKFLVWLVSFLVIGTFIGLWHQFYWDVYVAPEHNILEWNAKKVLFGHMPNIMITLAYLTLYESAGIFVLCQAFALAASTYFMRFPPFWGKTLVEN
jgi:hypothetical protein